MVSMTRISKRNTEQFASVDTYSALPKLIIGFILMVAALTAHAKESATPAGLWLARDEDGIATGYIRIMESQGVFTGIIENSAHPEKQEKTCSECRDERKNQKLIGMVMMRNVKAQDGIFVGDEILDPFTGNTYRVRLKLLEHNKMEIRGYIGITLLGRTQIWERAENGE